MTALNTNPNIANADDFYDALLRSHEGLSKEESDTFNARLILVLANHVGDMDALNQALAIAANKKD